MQLHKQIDLKSLQKTINTVRQDINTWKAADINLEKSGSTVDLLPVACRIESFFAGRCSGEIYICGPQQMFALIKISAGNDTDAIVAEVNEILKPYGGNMNISGINLQGLRSIEIKLHDLHRSANNQNIDGGFYNTRFTRQENKFFIIDDSSFVRSFIRKAIKDAGEIFEFSAPDGVVEAYLKELPDVVFTDLHMGGSMDGIDLLKKIISYDNTAFVVLQTSDVVRDKVLKAKEVGAKGFLAKPFTVERVQEEVLRCKTIKPLEKESR